MMPSHHNISFRSKMRYRFDNLMSKGPIALIAWLGILSLVLVTAAGLIITFAEFSQDNSEPPDFIEASWESLMRTLDPGTMGADTGWGFRLVMLFVTLGGIFIVSALIGVLATGLSGKLDELRKGHSFVIERGHTLILGWSEKIFPVITELVIANMNQNNAKIVILAHKDKVEMEDEIAAKAGDLKNTKIICRSGSTIDQYDLEIVNPQDAKSIIILASGETDPDISVIKTILALTNNPSRKKEPYHIVAEISSRRNKELAEIIAPGEVIIIHSEDLVSRVIAQTCRQSGLSVVYNELLDFEGDEIYFHEEAGLNGKSFKEALHMFDDSTIIGLRFSGGEIRVNPPMDYVISNGDKIITISEDDDTVKLSSNQNYNIDESAFSVKRKVPPETEKTLILGWNPSGFSLIREMNNYVAKGSEITIVAEGITSIKDEIDIMKNATKNLKILLKEGNATDRTTLESLKLKNYNHIIILCYTGIYSPEEADSRTLITLLHLRNIAEKTNNRFSIVSEMLDIRNKELAEVTKPDDFIISNRFISLLLSQLSENRELKAVYNDLFDAAGSEIYVKPAGDYVKPGIEINFHTVVESAARQGEIAIGYRLDEHSRNAAKNYGIEVNPKKSEMITLNENDKVIVIAED